MVAAWELKEAKKVACFVLHVDTTSVAWALGIRNLLPHAMPIIPLAGMPYDHARNAACEAVLRDGFEWLAFLDSDVIPGRDAFVRLMSHGLPIVSGVYHRRSPPHGVPVMLRGDPPQWITQYPANALIEVDYVGAGLMVIHRSVLERLPPQRPGHHWFDWRVQFSQLPPEQQPPNVGPNMSEDFTFCFPPGTWVNGLKVQPIENVKINDRVVNEAGGIRKVLSVSKRPYAGDMIRIRTSYLGEICATPKHRFLVRTTVPTNRQVLYRHSVIDEVVTMDVKTKKKLWLEAESIKAGDWLYVPKSRPLSDRRSKKSVFLSHYISMRKLTKFSDGLVGYKRTRKDALRINPSIKLTPDFCRLLGYYLAEGYVGKLKTVVHFAFNQNELEYIADCRGLLKTVFGAKSSAHTGNGATTVTVSSKVLGRLFVGVAGTGAKNKHLPRFWSKLGRECLGEVIKGYWRGDGYYGRTFSMNTVSEQLARDIQAALLRLDILCGVRVGETACSPIHTMRIPIYMSERFSQLVGYPIEKKTIMKQRRYMREIDRYFLVKVLSADEYRYEGDVYNLHMSGKESYTANLAVVHNCAHCRAHGYKIMVDTGVQSRHVGLAEATYGKMEPCNTTHLT